MFRSAFRLRVGTLRALIVLGLGLGAVAAGETRFHQYTKRFAEPALPAVPVAAGYLGGSGDEYLSGGAFLPDGTLVLAGTAWGPRFDPAGVQVQVLGTEGPAPAFTMPTKKNKDGTTAITPPDWTARTGAGFVVRMGPGNKSIARAVRLPWGSGSLTSIATDAAGNVYIAGLGGANLAALGRITPVAAPGIADPDDLFVARLDPDLKGIVWAITLKDSSGSPPRVVVLDDGTIAVTGKNAFHLDPSGALRKATPLALTKNWVRGVDPRSHAFATGGDAMTHTGWEPWRKPVLFVHDAAGRHLDTFYQWGEKIVGMNWSRLVSDSEVRVLSYDRNGMLLVSGWSDGGNSVFEYLPYDLKTSVYGHIERMTGRKPGLGFSTWGAGAGSFSHLMRIDPRSGELQAKTMYISFHISANKPSGADVDFLDTAADGSLVLAGDSGSGLIQTGRLVVNSLDPAKDYIGGRFLSVLTPGMDDIRFASAIPGGGKVALGRHSARTQATTAIGSRRIGDRIRVVAVGGAIHDPTFKPVAPVQAVFGGGSLDGQYVLLDMAAATAGPSSTSGPGPAPATDLGRGGDPKDAPAAGTYAVRPGMGQEWAVLVLRDLGGDRWPTIYAAAPSGNGSVVVPAGTGSFTLRGPGSDVQLGQTARQDRRLGGELLRSGTVTDGKGNAVPTMLFPDLEAAITLSGPGAATARITYNGQTLTLTGTATIRPSKPTGKGVNIGGRFTTTKGALGLESARPEAKSEQIEIEFWTPGRP
jgi:hypothetical protein